MKNECVIYDFETLSTDTSNGVVTSFALLQFTESRFVSDPYTYQELLGDCSYIKFNVAEQVEKYNRVLSKSTVDWWKEQGSEAIKQITPSGIDVSIDKFHDFLVDSVHDIKSVKKYYSRGNTFDPIFLESVLKSCGKTSPFHWRYVRDTRSMIDGMSFGFTVDTGFVPEGLDKFFVKHDPRHDVVMDVMRLQFLAQVIGAPQ